MSYAVKNDFIILKRIKLFIIHLEKLLVNFPKKDFICKDAIYQDSLELLEIICQANYEKDERYKKTYQIQALSKINKLDFYMERSYKLGYINDKQLERVTNELLSINKMIYAWCNSEK